MNKRVLCLTLLVMLCQFQGFLLGVAVMNKEANWWLVCIGMVGMMFVMSKMFYYVAFEEEEKIDE